MTILTAEETRRRVVASLRRRYRTEKLFRFYGLMSVLIGVSFLLVLFTTIIANGYGAFQQSFVRLEIQFDPAVIDPDGTRDPDVLAAANYPVLVKTSLGKLFPGVEDRVSRRELNALISSGGAFKLQAMAVADPGILGQTRELWLPADDEVNILVKGRDGGDPSGEGYARRLSDQQLAWIDQLEKSGRLAQRFNTTFFTAGDSREPELAGIWGATKGSFFMLLVTLLLSFPLGVAAAIYLEEFAPRSWLVDVIEVNINNLAAVPSIVFGLLGWRCSSISSASRVRRRWSAAWCFH